MLEEMLSYCGSEHKKERFYAAYCLVYFGLLAFILKVFKASNTFNNHVCAYSFRHIYG